ncbi:transglycosylase domain-containing protein [Bacillaceae bacterium]
MKSNKRKARKGKKKSDWIKWFFFLAIIAFFFAFAGYAAVIAAGTLMIDESKLDMSETSIIYDQNGQEVSKLYVENREYVTLDQIPPYLIDAIVVTEDVRFYEHSGVDPVAILRALYKDIRAGGKVEGGSTITQQLAKNMFLHHEKTFLRKTQEAMIAMALERKYSKQQILEMYLNRIFFGHAVYGVQTAAQFYFGKDVSELSLSEAAMLAALPKAPNTYSPFKNPEKAIERRNLVLSLMEENYEVLRSGVTKEEIERAKREELELNQEPQKENIHQAYIDYVVQEAVEKFGIPEDELYRGGYKIYTYLNPKVQQAIFDVYQNPEYFPPDGPKERVESAMVVVDPQTGGIVGMMGGRDYKAKGWNHALAKHQPGSTFKPIAVYAPALENGWKPYDLLEDSRQSFNGYEPRNYDGRYRGQVTMMEAVRLSLNVPAVWLLNEIGIDKSLEYVKKFDIRLEPEDRNLAIALGGLTKGVSPLEMAQAYTAFVRYGTMAEAHAIVRIESADETIIAEAKPQYKEVLHPQSAYYMHEMLEEAVRSGTGRAARIDRPVAGKTGTTQLPGVDGADKDGWFVGYTPEYVGAVWLGFERPDRQHVMYNASRYAANIFGEVMERALDGVPVHAFAKRPGGVEELAPPVQLTRITDLTAELGFDDELQIVLRWTPNADERVKYRIYRFLDSPEQKELVGETGGAVWTERVEIGSDSWYQYFVVPYDPESGREGEPSNIAQVNLDLLPEILRDAMEDYPPVDEDGEGEEDQPQDGELPNEGEDEGEQPDDRQDGGQPPGSESPNGSPQERSPEGGQSGGETPPDGQNPPQNGSSPNQQPSGGNRSGGSGQNPQQEIPQWIKDLLEQQGRRENAGTQ